MITHPGTNLISDCTLHLHCCIAACTVSLVLVCDLYGALESVVVLRRLRNCRDIIIIIIIIITNRV